MTAIHPDVLPFTQADGLGALSWQAVTWKVTPAARATLNDAFDLLAVEGFGLQVIGTNSRSAWVIDVAHALRFLGRYDADDAREAAAILRAAMSPK